MYIVHCTTYTFELFCVNEYMFDRLKYVACHVRALCACPSFVFSNLRFAGEKASKKQRKSAGTNLKVTYNYFGGGKTIGDLFRTRECRARFRSSFSLLAKTRKEVFHVKSTLLREKTGKNRRFRFQKTKGTPPCPFLPVRPVPLKSVPDTHSKANE